MKRFLPLVALACAPGCVSFSWTREARDAPIDPAALARLEPGSTDLDACLSAFGAPLWVWEEHEGSGAVLAYGGFDARDLGFRANVPLSRGVSPYVDYHHVDQRLRGLVLFFDDDWKLRAWRVGLLSDLTRDLRRPPAALADS